MIIEVLFDEQKVLIYRDNGIIERENLTEFDLSLEDADSLVCRKYKLRMTGDFDAVTV